MRQFVVYTVNDDRDVKGGMENRPDPFAIGGAALAGNGDVVGFPIELNLVGIGKMPSGQNILYGFTEFEQSGRVWAYRRHLAFALCWRSINLDPSGDQLRPTPVELENLDNVHSLRGIHLIAFTK
ncbi:hypothetical protein D3C75_1175980 [compost metagenome]